MLATWSNRRAELMLELKQLRAEQQAIEDDTVMINVHDHLESSVRTNLRDLQAEQHQLAQYAVSAG